MCVDIGSPAGMTRDALNPGEIRTACLALHLARAVPAWRGVRARLRPGLAAPQTSHADLRRHARPEP